MYTLRLSFKHNNQIPSEKHFQSPPSGIAAYYMCVLSVDHFVTLI